MHLILIAMTMYYVWSFIIVYAPVFTEGYLPFVLLPFIAYGLYFAPVIPLTALAASGIVHLVANATQRAVPKQQKRKSNIPPLP